MKFSNDEWKQVEKAHDQEQINSTQNQDQNLGEADNTVANMVTEQEADEYDVEKPDESDAGRHVQDETESKQIDN